MAQYRYFKLGPEATLFTDPKSGLTIVNKIPTSIKAERVAGSSQVNEALRGGHIVEITKEEFDKLNSKEARRAAAYPEPPVENTEAPSEDEEEDEDEDDEEEDEKDNEDEENIEDFTKSELIDLIKSNTEVPEEERVGITKMGKEELWAIYTKYKA